ncbi:PREDICTED: cytosolic sulfotransferase 5-like [Nelumbo nucifera]|uniref:Sulfotransferase n=1 Tax=Nelumbo nucifera TaxID=4432 RepID=A0A1U8A3K4_NELNU|nr:PREDICTED: cytosolic sulfotransferase 5-like [Nelumbo nucifera]
MQTTATQAPPPPPPPPHLKYLQEEVEELKGEGKHLLPSLPRGVGWICNHLYQYQGFWYTARKLLGAINCQGHFKAQDTDLLLVTNPKSGTTWLKAIAFAIVNRKRYSFSHHPLLTTNPHELVPFLEIKLYVDDHVPDLATFTSPRLFSTHLPYLSLPDSVKHSKCKVVFLCRDPKDTFISLWHFTSKLRTSGQEPISLEEAFHRFCRGVSLYGPFWDHVLGYWNESQERPDRVCFFKYEEMKEQPAVHIRRLAKFLGYPFSPEEEEEGTVEEIFRLCSFDTLSNLDVNKNGKMESGEEYRTFFRRGVVGDWVNYLTPEMVDEFNRITDQKLGGSGLTF